MSQRHGLSAPTAPLILGAAMLLLSGCQALYDDTKGWANRLEASIIEATREQPGDTDTPEATGDTPEMAQGEPEAKMTKQPSSDQTATLTPTPRPVGTPVLIEPNPAEDLRQDDLLLEELPNPTEPAPSKDAKATPAPAGEGKAAMQPSDAVAASARALTEDSDTATQKSKSRSESAANGSKTAAPPPPKRKPQTAAQPKPGDDVAMVLHLSSLRSEQAAKREWSDLQKTFPEPLGSLDAEIQRTELGDKGTFYRVLAGPLPSRSAAKEACAVVKSKDAKQYCRIMSSRPKS